MTYSQALQPWTHAAATDRTGPAHTWVRSWPDDCDALRSEVVREGWQWHSVEDLGSNPAPALAVFEIFEQRYSAQIQSREWLSLEEGHVMLAVGPDVPWNIKELIQIARCGRAVNVHLAVSAARLDEVGSRPEYLRKFRDNIEGWYSRPQTLRCTA